MSKKGNKTHTQYSMLDSLVASTPQLQHNWYRRQAHIVRKNGHVARCVIETLQIHEGETSVIVAFNEKGTLKKKAVCPLMISSAHVLWHTQKAVSSDDEDDPELKYPIGPPDLNIPLPPLVCSNVYLLKPEQARKLKWKLSQVNNVLGLLTRINVE